MASSMPIGFVSLTEYASMVGGSCSSRSGYTDCIDRGCSGVYRLGHVYHGLAPIIHGWGFGG